jgi:hypothetical protein
MRLGDWWVHVWCEFVSPYKEVDDGWGDELEEGDEEGQEARPEQVRTNTPYCKQTKMLKNSLWIGGQAVRKIGSVEKTYVAGTRCTD